MSGNHTTSNHGRTPNGDPVPPQTLGSPCELPLDAGDDVTWWQPSWTDAWRHLGWRWILFTPALLMLALLFGGIFYSRLWWVFQLMGGYGFKLAAMAFCIPFALAAYALGQATKSRTDPFCIHCGYDLAGLPDNYRSPECGRPSNWRVI